MNIFTKMLDESRVPYEFIDNVLNKKEYPNTSYIIALKNSLRYFDKEDKFLGVKYLGNN